MANFSSYLNSQGSGFGANNPAVLPPPSPPSGSPNPFSGTNSGDMMGELSKTYSSLGSMYDYSNYTKTANAQADLQMSTGLQTANSAAREGVQRAANSGGQVNGGMLRAQALLPVMQSVAGLKTNAAGVALDSSQKQATTAAGIASSMASLRLNYVQSLADYTSKQDANATSQYGIASQANTAANANATNIFGINTQAKTAAQADATNRFGITSAAQTAQNSLDWTKNIQQQAQNQTNTNQSGQLALGNASLAANTLQQQNQLDWQKQYQSGQLYQGQEQITNNQANTSAQLAMQKAQLLSSQRYGSSNATSYIPGYGTNTGNQNAATDPGQNADARFNAIQKILGY